MGTTAISDERISFEATVMVLRQELMNYFKGSCIDRVAHSDALRIVDLNRDSEPRYTYQRLQRNLERPFLLMLGDAPILTMRCAPDTVIFHAPLSRSPQFRQLRKELDKFLNHYLKGVRKEESHANVVYH